MATVMLDQDYATIEANLRRIFPSWDGGEFQVVGVLDEGLWCNGQNAAWSTDARQFAEHVKCFGYDGYSLAIGEHAAADVRREELLRAVEAPPALRGALVASTYSATDAFRRIPIHAAVCEERNAALIAVTGPAGDVESEAYARLFAAAPETVAALRRLVDVVRGKWPDIDWAVDTSAWGTPMRAALAAIGKVDGP